MFVLALLTAIEGKVKATSKVFPVFN